MAGSWPWPAAEIRDSLTAIFAACGRPLTKRFATRHGGVAKIGYPNVAEFRAVPLPFEGFDGFAAVLEMVTADGRAAVIRAAPGRWYPTDGGPTFRLASPQPSLVHARSGKRVPAATIKQRQLQADGTNYLDIVYLPMFEERPRAWVILDVDRPAVPAHLARRLGRSSRRRGRARPRAAAGTVPQLVLLVVGLELGSSADPRRPRAVGPDQAQARLPARSPPIAAAS